MTTTMQTTVTARPYVRVSRDKSGRLRSVEEQLDDARQLAETEGWALGAAYAEDGAVSASKYATKVRAGFAALVADLERDRFGASVLILWEPSRGSRKLSEWARFIELLEERGVRLHVVSHGRTYDLANPRDVRSLHDDGVDAQYESGKTSQRVQRALTANAENGLPSGVVPFGFKRRYDARTRRFIAQEPMPAEAKVIRELFSRLEKGHALSAIARDFAARGITNRSGKPFQPAQLRYLALNASYAGYVVHNGKRYDAAWKPLVPRRRFLAVERMLTARERTRNRHARAHHLLSAIALCGVCGCTLRFSPQKGRYACNPHGHVTVDETELDAHVEARILNRLAHDDAGTGLRARNVDDDELRRVRDELADARAKLDELRREVAADRLSVSSLVAVEPAMLARVADLERHERELATPSVLHGLVTPGADVHKQWAAMPMTARREVARLMLTVEVLGVLRVVPSPIRGHRVPVEQRVEWETLTSYTM